MKYLYVLLFLFSSNVSYAKIYECIATVGDKTGVLHFVDTTTNFEYIWLFFKYPNIYHSCGTEIGSDKLKCTLSSKVEGVRTTFSQAEIMVGDQYLTVSSPICENGLGCTIECFLQQ